MLDKLSTMAGIVTRQFSSENPTAEKGGGCKWDPDPSNPDLPYSRMAVNLGRGWKVRPYVPLKAGETLVMADIEGMGVINQIFFTTDCPRPSELILRMYWDDEEEPSVEVPVGAFFCIGFDNHPHLVSSEPITVAPRRGCNSYWHMPFRKHARITITHEGHVDAGIIAYRVLYHEQHVAEDEAYFHAQYRHSLTTKEYPEHVILDGVKGKGLYVGTYIAWNTYCSGWWGEGEVKFYLDGDTEFPTLCDNGTEDYFGGAWNFSDGKKYPDLEYLEQPFSSPYLGMPLALTDNRAGCRKFGMYRWHINDCIGFEEDLRVTVQALGWYPNGTYRPLTDDVYSVAYYYQTEPHQPFPKLPAVEDRWER